MKPTDVIALTRVNPMGFREISVQEAARNQDAFRIIDVRSPEEFHGELSHIEGAESVPLEHLAHTIASWDQDHPLLLVCRSGRRSALANMLLVQAGFSLPVNLEGGMLTWNARGLPTAADQVAVAPADDAVPPVEEIMALARINRLGYRDISVRDAARGLSVFRVIDVRSPEEFTGALSHIEGTENVPLDRLPGPITGWNRDERLLVVCRSGGRSAMASQILMQSGFTNVVNLMGGMMEWNAHGLTTAADHRGGTAQPDTMDARRPLGRSTGFPFGIRRLFEGGL